MNKKYNVLAKLVFLIFIILIIVGIILKGSRVRASNGDGGVKPVKAIDAPVVIQGNQFWPADYNYVITTEVKVPAGSSLSIEEGAQISISNNASFNVDGGSLNIGSPSLGVAGSPESSWPVTLNSKPGDFYLDINNYIGSSVDLKLADEVFAFPFYNSADTSRVNIDIFGGGYNNVFSVNNRGVLNIRKTDIEGVPSGVNPITYSDLERTLFAAYNNSKINAFETNINNIEVKGTQAFYEDNKSRVVLYKNNINGFAGNSFANIFSGSGLNVLKSKINDIKVNKGISVFSSASLNFQKSSISANALRANSDSSGICFSGSNGSAITVLNSDIGPCFIGFSFFGTGNYKINQNNISGNGDVVLNFSPSVDLKNNWWGRADGPKPVDLSSLDSDGNYSTSEYISAIKNQNAIEDYSSGVIATPFSPVQFKDSNCCSSVLFIPGFQGSRLYKKGLIGIENQLWEPNRNKDVESLFLNSHGTPIDSSVYTRDVIGKTNFLGPLGALDIYQSLTDFFAKEKSDGNIKDFQTVPYDWRNLPSNILSSGIKMDSTTVRLEDKIKEMASSSGSGKVIIVAHSYGGLLAKSLAESLEKEGLDDLIESVVLVSVPEYGTPQAIPSLLCGDNEDLLGGLILSKNTSITLGKNMLSAHALLPSSSYFTLSDGIYNQKNLISFDGWTVAHLMLGGQGGQGGFGGQSGNRIDSAPLLAYFLKNKNTSPVNSFVFDKAVAEHNLIDNYSANLSVKTYSIVAVGIPTLSGLNYIKPKCRGFFFCSPSTSSNPDFTRNYSPMGDGVVIAHNLGARSGSVFTVDIGKENEVKKTAPAYFREDPVSHKDVFRSSGVKDILHAILSRSKKETLMINSFGELRNPYVSYVSGSLSKPGPILGSYGNTSVFTGISKIADTAEDSDFVNRFNNSKILTTEVYGPVTLQTNYKLITDLQNKPFELLDSTSLANLANRIVNYTSYSDNNRSGIVALVPSGFSSVGGYGPGVLGQGSGVGTAQIVTKISGDGSSTENIYPIISVTPSTTFGVDTSTTTIAIDNNSDGVTDKKIVPIQTNTGPSATTTVSTSTETESLSTSTDSIGDAFARAKARLQASLASTTAASSSAYLVNKYIEKLDIAQRKYQKTGVWQSLVLMKSFHSNLESNMGTISNLITTYNKQQNFYSFNNFLSTGKKVLLLNQRQKDIREEILAYIEIHGAYSELIGKMGEGL